MNHYDYCYVGSNADSFWFNATDPELLQFMSNEMKKHFPKAKNDQKRKLPNGDAFDLRLTFPDYKTLEAVWWIIKVLCINSWEPLGLAENTHSFRRLSTSK
jgi:hypothetical protein